MRQDISERGETVAYVHSVEAETVEAWVRAVRGWSEVPDVDWGYIGGWARIAVLGTPEQITKVREACAALLPALHVMLPKLYPTVYGGEEAKVTCLHQGHPQYPSAGQTYPFE